jgi:hypothetical protein
MEPFVDLVGLKGTDSEGEPGPISVVGELGRQGIDADLVANAGL